MFEFILWLVLVFQGSPAGDAPKGSNDGPGRQGTSL
jgi:hypothetical protein